MYYLRGLHVYKLGQEEVVTAECRRKYSLLSFETWRLNLGHLEPLETLRREGLGVVGCREGDRWTVFTQWR